MDIVLGQDLTQIVFVSLNSAYPHLDVLTLWEGIQGNTVPQRRTTTNIEARFENITNPSLPRTPPQTPVADHTASIDRTPVSSAHEALVTVHIRLGEPFSDHCARAEDLVREKSEWLTTYVNPEHVNAKLSSLECSKDVGGKTAIKIVAGEDLMRIVAGGLGHIYPKLDGDGLWTKLALAPIMRE